MTMTREHDILALRAIDGGGVALTADVEIDLEDRGLIVTDGGPYARLTDIGRALLVTRLYWKDEGDVEGVIDSEPVGPLTGIDEQAMKADPNIDPDSVGMPYGYRPGWFVDFGWVTLSTARARAIELGVPLGES